MTDTPALFVWRSSETTESNTQRLTAAIAPKILGELFNVDGALCRVHDGTPVAINKEDMRGIMNRDIRTPKLIDHGTNGKPKLEATFVPLEFPLAGSKHDLGGPTEKTLLQLIDNLLPLVAHAPRPPVTFKDAQLETVKQRLRTGEPAATIAATFHAEVDQIRAIGREAGIMVH
jgi:hypothetical protein